MYKYSRLHDYNMMTDMDLNDPDIPKKRCTPKRKVASSICISLLLIIFMGIFVLVPVIFMYSIDLQRLLIFTRMDLHDNREYFEKYRFPSYQNKYIDVKDLNDDRKILLGVWHILPLTLAYEALQKPNFSYDNALRNSNYSILIYFHGTGEDRSNSDRAYQLFSSFFHVIAFDYRDYADSSSGDLTEKSVVSDCVQLYHWLRTKTNSPIYIWGHSLGSALATSTVAILERMNEYPKALILESAFTSLYDELYVHPYGKFFAWLPWFEPTITTPLQKNGFIFDTAKTLQEIVCPVMILHAEDDEIVPVKFGRELYDIATNRTGEAKNKTVYHEFEKKLGLGHIFIYQDPFLKYYIWEFLALLNDTRTEIPK